MTKAAELKQKLEEIHAQLQALGDLSQIIEQNKDLSQLGSDLKKTQGELDILLESIPQHKNELQSLISEAGSLKTQVSNKDKEVDILLGKIGELQKKVENLKQETEIQLGKAANAKLANSFERVKEELEEDRSKWFPWFVGGVGTLVIVTILIVIWQIYFEKQTIYSWSFLVKLALNSPLVYFVIFVNREYNRTRSLIEEYTFKASIARSFEAYKDIIESAYSNYQKDIYQQKLSFLLSAIRDLYSSPMKNVRANYIKEKENTPDILERAKSAVTDTLQEKLTEK